MRQDEGNTAELSENPWNDRSALPTPAGKTVIWATVLYLTACIGIPFSTSFFPSLIVCCLLGFGCLRMTWRDRSGGIMALILCALGLSVVVYDASLGVILLAVTVGTATGAYLMTVRKNVYVLILFPVLAGALTYGVTQNWQTALLGLAVLPSVILLAVATTMGERRTTAVLFATGGILLSMLAVILWFLYHRYGNVGRDAVLTLLQSWREQTVAEILKIRDATVRLAGNTAEAQELSEIMSDGNIREAVAGAFNLFPAVLLVLCEIPAFLAQKILNAVYTDSGLGCVVLPENEFFTMSIPSCVIFPVAFLISLFGSPTDLAIAVAQNISLILLPGVCVLGFRMLWKRFLYSQAGGKIFLIFGALFLMCFNFAYVFYLVGLLGAYDRIARALHHVAERKNGGQ